MLQEDEPFGDEAWPLGPSWAARIQSCQLYGLVLDGAVDASAWTMVANRRGLIEALCGRRARSRDATLGVCATGMSVRTRGSHCAVTAQGFWASPVIVNRAALRAAVRQAPDDAVHLEYADGWLCAEGVRLKAREL